MDWINNWHIEITESIKQSFEEIDKIMKDIRWIIRKDIALNMRQST